MTRPLDRIQSTYEENKEGYEKCSKQFLSVAEMFDNNMELIRKIEPEKKSLKEKIEKCKGKLSKMNVSV